MTTTSVSSTEKRRPGIKQKVAKAARWLHIYLSMVSFGIVLFFAVTGLTLNHPDWFASAMKTRLGHGAVDRALLQTPATNEPDKSALVESVRYNDRSGSPCRGIIFSLPSCRGSFPPSSCSCASCRGCW